MSLLGWLFGKKGFTQEVHVSLDESVFKGLHQEVINNNNIIP